MLTIIMAIVILSLAATTVYFWYKSRLFCGMYRQQAIICRNLGTYHRRPAPKRREHTEPKPTAGLDLQDAVAGIYRDSEKFIDGAVNLARIGKGLRQLDITYEDKLSQILEAIGYKVIRDTNRYDGCPCVVKPK